MLIRPAGANDLKAMHAIGKACVPGIPATGRDRLEAVVDEACLVLIGELDGAAAGFAVILDESASYASANFRWFKDRHPQFAYIDRIGALPQARGSGLGRALYARVFNLIGDRRRWLCFEVHERPPNPGSLQFHRKLGFDVVGCADYGADDKAVVFLETALPRKSTAG